MPEFLVRYKVPEEMDLEWQIEEIKKQAVAIAEAVKAAASKVFFDWEVVYEVREFGPCAGQPDFAVTGWITERAEVTLEVVLQGQAAALAAMQEHAFNYQRVDCWWQMVRGKWGCAQGLKQP